MSGPRSCTDLEVHECDTEAWVEKSVDVVMVLAGVTSQANDSPGCRAEDPKRGLKECNVARNRLQALNWPFVALSPPNSS